MRCMNCGPYVLHANLGSSQLYAFWILQASSNLHFPPYNQ